MGLISEALLVWLLSVSLWVSFRVLRYPDLGLEQVGVFLAALVVVRGSTIEALPVLAVSVIILATVMSALRILLKVNGVLVALCMGYALYSASLVVMDGPNRALTGHSPAGDAAAFIPRIVASLACGLLVIGALRSPPGELLLAAGSNRDLYVRLSSRRSLFLLHLVGHVLALTPATIFAAQMVTRSGFVDVGITYGRLLQALFVTLTTISVYPRCRFEIAGPIMFLPAMISIVVGRLLLETGLSPSLYSGGLALALLIVLLALRSSRGRVFRIEEALRS